MIFCPSANPQTNQKLTKSLTKSVETGTPHKNVPPKRGGTQTSNQLFSNEHATTQSRSAGRGKYLCLARPCGAVSERERYFPRPALRSSQRHALVVHHLLLKVRLRVVAHRAHLGRLGTNMQVPAVQALPHLYALALKHLARLNALDEFVVALLVGLLDGGDTTELCGNLGKASSSAVLANSSYIVVHS